MFNFGDYKQENLFDYDTYNFILITFLFDLFDCGYLVFILKSCLIFLLRTFRVLLIAW
jgi:hypothetical protein